MKISRLLITGFITGLIAASCSSDKGSFSISGKITHAEGQTVYLEELHVSSAKVIDSVKINKDGEFKFKGKTGIPAFYILKLTPANFITLLVDSVEQLVVRADAADFSRNYHVEGSPGSVQVKILRDHLAVTRKKLDSLTTLHNMYRGHANFERMNREWSHLYDSLKQKQSEFTQQFVMSNPFSMASVYGLYQKYDENEYVIDDLHTMRVAASALHTIYPGSGHVKALYQNTLQLMKLEQNAKLRQFVQEQGENSPDIILPNPDGKEVSLSSFRGKVVLLQFWSALDRNSRIQNEALVEAYRKYRNKGFEIFQVSIDEDRPDWLEAIEKDRLTWVNVGDMEGSNRALMLYNIQSIPYNYLLNEDGEIIAQNLKGINLDRTLAQLFK
jgi:peroxiredoxin